MTQDVRTNISDFVRESAKSQPNFTAMVQGGRSLNWAQFDELIDEIGSALASFGLVAGNRVALCAMNSIEAIAAYFAVVRAGYVLVPINPALEDVDTILDETNPRVVFADAIGAPRVRGAQRTLVLFDVPPQGDELTFAQLLERASANVPPSPTDPEALAAIIYTPDAAGKLRGAMLTHRALIANVEQISALGVTAINPEDRVLLVMPVFHIFALNAILGQVAKQGATAIVVPRFDPQGTLEIIRDNKVTVVPIAPPVIAAWSDGVDKVSYFESVRHVFSGAALLDPELEIEFLKTSGTVLDQGWGITEAGPVIATTIGIPRQAGPLPRGFVGQALPGIEIKSREGGSDASEILIRGANLFNGYWPDGSGGPQSDGWYPTGEIGFVDESGYVTIVERQNDMIEVSGFQVFPFEIEQVLNEISGVDQAVVIGVPDDETGQSVRALVVGEASEAQILGAASKRLAQYKVPTSIVKLTNLPTAADRTHLRALARSKDLGLE